MYVKYMDSYKCKASVVVPWYSFHLSPLKNDSLSLCVFIFLVTPSHLMQIS